jgi:hypothetical protein
MKHPDRRLAAADPLRHDVDALPDQAGQALAQEIMMQNVSEDAKPVKRRRGLLLVAAAVIAGVIAAPGVATGGVTVYDSMYSGIFGRAEDGESAGTEEYLNSDSPEIVALVQQLAAERPLAPGASYDRLINRYPMAERILLQRTALASEVSYYAACSWLRHWLAGDAAARAAAQPTIDTIPSWEFGPVAVDDATGYSEGPGPNGTTVRYTRQWTMMHQIALETRGGIVFNVQTFVTANC